MQRQYELLKGLLEPVISGLGYELWGLQLIGSGAGRILRVYIDSTTDAGIVVDDCQKVSHQITGVLDVEDPIKGHYVLEVSSPGLDRILFTSEQFRHYVGEMISVRLHRKIDGRRRFQGKLTAVHTLEIEMEDEMQQYRLPFCDIDMARLVPEL